MKRELQSSSHCRHLVMYHLIFCAKYRRKIFANKDFGEAMKNELVAISKKYDFSIDTIDLDYAKPDHMHILVRSVPTIAPYQIVRVLKQESTVWAWKNFEQWLKKFYYGGMRHIFTRGYFCASVGNVSAQNVADYLEKQGRNDLC